MLIKVNKNSKRLKDDNGFLIVKENPLIMSGVFDYAKNEIMEDAENNDIIRLYRDFKHLEDIKEMFKNKPLMLNHKWVGRDVNQVDGSIGTEIVSDYPYLKADIIIYNKDLIESIERGENVELSPAFKAKIIPKKGIFEGKQYDGEQIIESVNHVAVVENGRAGESLKILDSKEQLMEEKNNNFIEKLTNYLLKFKEKENIELKDDENSRREIIREIMALAAKSDNEFKGGEDEKIETIAKLAEKLAYDKNLEAKDSDDKKEVKDDDEEIEEKIEAKEDDDLDDKMLTKLTKIVNDLIEKKLNNFKEQIKEEEIELQDSYNEVKKALGCDFDYLNKNPKDIYRFGYEALSGDSLTKNMDAKTAFRILNKNKTKTLHFEALDSKTKSTVYDKILANLE